MKTQERALALGAKDAEAGSAWARISSTRLLAVIWVAVIALAVAVELTK